MSEMKEDLFEEMAEMNKRDVAPLTTEVSCPSCDWKGIIADCGMAQEQDGWENPVYMINTCPECGEAVEI